jgi:hypothetical protein
MPLATANLSPPLTFYMTNGRSNLTDNAFVPWSFQFNKPLHLLLTPSEFDFQVLKK